MIPAQKRTNSTKSNIERGISTVGITVTVHFIHRRLRAVFRTPAQASNAEAYERYDNGERNCQQRKKSD